MTIHDIVSNQSIKSQLVMSLHIVNDQVER